jgi:hypothetical protein
MVSLGAFCQMILLIWMRIEHKGFRYSFSKPTRVAYLLFRVGIAFGHLSLRWFKGPVERQMMYHGFLSLVVNIMDILLKLVKEKDETMRATIMLEKGEHGSDSTEIELNRTPSSSVDHH